MSKRTIMVLSILWLVILVAAVSSSLTLFFSGVNVDALMSGIQAGGAENVVVSPEQYALIERFERAQAVLDIIEENFYQDVDEEIVLTGALRGMLAALNDPYTFYYTPEELTSHNDQNTGIYEGVGLQLLSDRDGALTVTRTFKGGPAQEAGIKAGDRIVAVNGEPVNGETSRNMNEAIEKIKGAPGSTVRLTISRAGALLNFEVARRTVSINRVEYQMLDDDIGYIMIYEFMGDNVRGFTEAMTALKDAKGLIIDVRSNPGGYLSDVVQIADMLLPEGLIVYIENRAGQRENYYSSAKYYGKPLAILVNGMSASASEILAGSVQDYGVGTIIGETTFGKGLVQTLIPFRSDGAGLQLTTSRYFTPKGRSIHGTGIEPDIEVSRDTDFDFTISEPSPERDAQLRAAIDVIREKISKD